MKIGFPVLKKSHSNSLEFDLSMHNSNYFGVFDSTDQSIRIRTTKSLSSDGKDFDLIQFLSDEKITSIISPGFHAMAYRFFQHNNITVYQAVNGHILTNIGMLLQNKLVPFGLHNNVQKSTCSSSCSSCSSTCNQTIQQVVAI